MLILRAHWRPTKCMCRWVAVGNRGRYLRRNEVPVCNILVIFLYLTLQGLRIRGFQVTILINHIRQSFIWLRIFYITKLSEEYCICLLKTINNGTNNILVWTPQSYLKNLKTKDGFLVFRGLKGTLKPDEHTCWNIYISFMHWSSRTTIII